MDPQGQRQDQEEKGKVNQRWWFFFLAPATCGPPESLSSLSLLPARISVTGKREESSASLLLVLPVTPSQVPQEQAVRPLPLSLSLFQLNTPYLSPGHKPPRAPPFMSLQVIAHSPGAPSTEKPSKTTIPNYIP